MQGLASTSLGTLITGLLDLYPTDQYAPWATAVPAHAPEGETLLAPWLDQQQPDAAGMCPPPKWHIATPDEVAFARELVDLHMGTALTQLQAFCADRSLPPVGASLTDPAAGFRLGTAITVSGWGVRWSTYECLNSMCSRRLSRR
jgi:hypothetical protein